MDAAGHVRAVADGRSRPRRTPVSPLAHLLPGFASRSPEGGVGYPVPSRMALLIPGVAAVSRAAGRRRAAALPAVTAVPLTHEPMSEEERRAYRAAEKAENARWAAVMIPELPPHLHGAAINMLATTNSSAASVQATLIGLAETTRPPPPPPPPAPRSGAERLAARIAEHQARVGAAQAPSAEAAALAENADAVDFGRFAARTMAKVRHTPGALAPTTDPRSHR